MKQIIVFLILITASSLCYAQGLDSYKTIRTGELAGSAAASQMPNQPCKLVMFKAESSNAGGVYIGYSSGVTVADGTTDTVTGFSLEPGEQSPWLPTDDLNKFWRICDNAGDDLTYITMDY